MLLRLLMVGLVALFSVCLALLVLQNHQITRRARWSFAAMCFGIAFWQILVVASDFENSNALALNRAVFIFPMITFVGFLFFVRTLLPGKKQAKNKADKWLAIVALVIAVQPLIVSDVVARYDDFSVFQGYDLARGPFYIPYVVALLIIAIRAFYTLVIANRRSSTIIKRQLRVIFYGFAAAIIVGVLSNVVLPIITGSSFYSVFGILAAFIFVSAVAYSIVRNQFLDIRPIIARSAAYIFSIGLLLAICAVLTYVLLDGIVFRDDSMNVLQRSVLVLLAVGMGLLFQPLKRFFDKLSNAVFFRDAYNAESLIANLNTVLIGKNTIHELLQDSAKTIGATMKAEFCIFGVRRIESDIPIIVGSGIHKEFSKTDIEAVSKITYATGQKILVTNQLEDGDLKKILKRYGIEILVRLTTHPQEHVAGIGYLTLGAKRSGAVYSKQDISVLDILADTTTIAIQNALQFEQIQAFNVTLQQKVDEATRKLRRSNTKLQNLDETKDEFISMASHQLRTPLTSVKGYLSMVLDGDAGDVTDMQRKLLNQAYVSSQRMVYTIADLLNVSRLKTGKFIIERSPVNLGDVVQQEITSLAEAALAKNITLVYVPPDFCPPLMLDDTKIRQVIMNFIDNAIYYTPAKGTITVSIAATAKMLELKVVDTGMGVPTAAQPHMFTKFYRASNAQKARPDGTGLGLFMAKKIIIAQGGSLIFKSQEDKGSTFGFSFPLVRE